MNLEQAFKELKALHYDAKLEDKGVITELETLSKDKINENNRTELSRKWKLYTQSFFEKLNIKTMKTGITIISQQQYQAWRTFQYIQDEYGLKNVTLTETLPGVDKHLFEKTCEGILEDKVLETLTNDAERKEHKEYNLQLFRDFTCTFDDDAYKEVSKLCSQTSDKESANSEDSSVSKWLAELVELRRTHKRHTDCIEQKETFWTKISDELSSQGINVESEEVICLITKEQFSRIETLKKLRHEVNEKYKD